MYIVLAAFSVLTMILLPVILAILLRRHYTVPWLYFVVGILTFVGAQIVHLPLNKLLANLGILPEGAQQGWQLVQTALVLGLTAGLTEELARAGGYAIVRKARRVEDGIMMGLGHGGLEAMIVASLTAAGVGSLWFMKGLESLPSSLTAEQMSILEQQLAQISATPLVALAPLVERVIAITLHVSLSVIVLLAFQKRNWLYVLVAILYHTAADAIAVVAVQSLDNAWLIEGLLALAAVPGALVLWRVRPVSSGPVDARAGRSLSTELGRFGSAIRKELFYQWRSRRLIIVLAVFLVFGMLSPLLGRFQAEILRSLEGAEQFADLIPDPTVGDAYTQYIKNITQFGFLLAILMGMGAVVGEREKGTAAMVLSKPLSRWAFVASKFMAQAAVYFLAFILAWAAAYYYIIFLFHVSDLGSFLAANVLLFIWLLVFVAATLFGSSVARSTGAAAGIAAVLAVALLLANYLPRVGPLAPGGLVTWAGQLLSGVQGPPNAGSLIMSVNLILLLVIGALAVFEEQEV